jgi:hypothetical protein
MDKYLRIAGFSCLHGAPWCNARSASSSLSPCKPLRVEKAKEGEVNQAEWIKEKGNGAFTSFRRCDMLLGPPKYQPFIQLSSLSIKPDIVTT